jgi:hypothetical protein
VDHPEYGEVIQLQGDQRNDVCEFLSKSGLATSEQVCEIVCVCVCVCVCLLCVCLCARALVRVHTRVYAASAPASACDLRARV